MTVSEVRPDGKETFVQNGWLRASERKLDPRKSTLLEPVPSLPRAPMPRRCPQGRWTKVTVPLYYEGHAYRAGSRIRVTIAAPGGDQPIWAFGETVPRGHATVSVAYSRAMPSRLVLPGRARRRRAHAAAALPGPARRAVPHLRPRRKALGGRTQPQRGERRSLRDQPATRPVAATAAPSTQTPVQPSLPYRAEAAADIAAAPAK